ncbi:hypothetical protein FBU59_001969 [Linderina macrospora]|uniref:Uncharacterized protein n=1 Tax=Linderina macrospora TaxID=4868 RepID=A0ACC1JCN0_9FUNG|nr:hypothetical protein FBU59_001969 [Linderina macrospora]
MFLANRLTFDMEAKLLFMLEKLPSNLFFRNMSWFSQRFLATPESESLYCDLIRYICGVFHPSNALLASNILPRYVLLGAILRLIRSQVVAANAKLALFYDWLFYDPQVDSIMNIEPGVLIMARSLERYTHMTVTFIEFLGFTADAYCPNLANAIRRSIGLAMQDAVEKGVVQSLLPIYEHPKVDDATRKQMQVLFPGLVPAQSSAQQNAFDSDPMSLDPNADIDMSEVAELGNGVEPLALNTDATRPATVPTSVSDPPPTISPVISSPAQSQQTASEPELPPLPPPPTLPLDPVSQMFSDELPLQAMEPASIAPLEPVALNGNSLEQSTEDVGCDDSESEDLESIGLVADIEDHSSSPLPTGEQALENPSLWLFGSALKDFATNFRSGDTGKASAAIGEIIEVFAQSEAPAKAVSNVFAYALEDFEPEDIETTAELIESGDSESVEHDILHTLFSVIAPYMDRASMSRDRLLSLLVQLTAAIPDIGFRWLLYAVDDARRPQLYKDYVGQHAEGTMQAALARDMRLLQERFNMLFYNVLPDIYKAFPAEFPGNRAIIKSVVAMIDQPQVYRLNMLMTKGELRLFGNRAARAICGTTEYDAFEQVCLWQLVAGELAGDATAVLKIARALLLTQELDPSMNSEAANGLLSLLRSVPPTKEILRVLVQKCLQGDDAVDLCGSAMTAWARSRREDLAGGIRAVASEGSISEFVAMWIHRFGVKVGHCEIFKQACVIQAEPEPEPEPAPVPVKSPSPSPVPALPEPESKPEPVDEDAEAAIPVKKAASPKKAPVEKETADPEVPAKRRRPMTRLQKRQTKRQRRKVITSDDDEEEDEEEDKPVIVTEDSSDDSLSDLSSLSSNDDSDF